MQDYSFGKPVLISTPARVEVRTIGDAIDIVRSHLLQKFTFSRLNLLLMLERVREHEVEEARLAFWLWAGSEQISAT